MERTNAFLCDRTILAKGRVRCCLRWWSGRRYAWAGLITAIRARAGGPARAEAAGRGRALHFNCIVSCNEQVIWPGINGGDNVTRLVTSCAPPPPPAGPACRRSCRGQMFIFYVISRIYCAIRLSIVIYASFNLALFVDSRDFAHKKRNIFLCRNTKPSAFGVEWRVPRFVMFIFVMAPIENSLMVGDCFLTIERQVLMRVRPQYTWPRTHLAREASDTRARDQAGVFAIIYARRSAASHCASPNGQE